MPLTNTEVDSAVPTGGTPSRSLTNAALKEVIIDIAAKADLSHTHTAADVTDSTIAGRNMLLAADAAAQTALLNNFTSTLKGLTPLSGGGTTNYLRADGTWASPPGGGGAWGGITGTLANQTDLQTALDAKASILAPVTLSSNTSLTAASHANRTIFVDTAGLTLTINNDATGGWATDDSLDIQAVGSGTFTLVQGTATLTTDSGCSADSTTAVGKRVQAQRTGTNAWRTNSTIIVSGSVGNIKAYRSVGSFSAPTSSGESSDLTTLNIEPLTANGDFVIGHCRLEAGNEASESSTIRIYLNGAIVYQATVETNTRSFGFKFFIERTSDTTVRVMPMFGTEAINPSSSVWSSVTVTSLSAGATLAIRHHRAALQSKTVTYLRLSASVERA